MEKPVAKRSDRTAESASERPETPAESGDADRMETKATVSRPTGPRERLCEGNPPEMRGNTVENENRGATRFPARAGQKKSDMSKPAIIAVAALAFLVLPSVPAESRDAVGARPFESVERLPAHGKKHRRKKRKHRRKKKPKFQFEFFFGDPYGGYAPPRHWRRRHRGNYHRHWKRRRWREEVWCYWDYVWDVEVCERH